MARKRRGQVTVELAVLFTFVIGALVFMGFYLQRGAQGQVKSNADSLGQQFSLSGAWNSKVTQTSSQISASNKVTTTSTSNSTYTHTVK